MYKGIRSSAGWPTFEGETKGITEISSWVIAAKAMAVKRQVVRQDALLLVEDLEVLRQRQFREGGFCATDAMQSANQLTYTTIMAIWAIIESLTALPDELSPTETKDLKSAVVRGFRWLVSTKNPASLWLPRTWSRRTIYPGLSAQVLTVLKLAEISRILVPVPQLNETISQFLYFSESHIESWQFDEPEANLGYGPGDVLLKGERNFRLESSVFFWVPWSRALFGLLLRTQHPETKRIESMLKMVLNSACRAVTEYSLVLGTPLIGELLIGASFLPSPRDKRQSGGPTKQQRNQNVQRHCDSVE